ncbi:hypothetical protein PTNB85_07029 [Pyrenophora teres f. teres]|uniref:WAP domain-containing protein n=1 Tax=Pyrenophora teres f. teres TaxID=97479 RepID=A0A6S6WDZ4_9PLEO|nr:hypothetical protein HRS9139_08290 [Pyrenophora teres f. teres]KAE8832637.1 hypothetical protein PTNB85_07029 [Pyrenophora teres f. teres]KAE8856298.1 hypothetical protein PTNB29_09137 [Pyrenophora teres f. teres]CAE7213612.1 hypothetical protein PTTW11_10436 [Pyrenophora teres f. teres]
MQFTTLLILLVASVCEARTCVMHQELVPGTICIVIDGSGKCNQPDNVRGTCPSGWKESGTGISDGCKVDSDCKSTVTCCQG